MQTEIVIIGLGETGLSCLYYFQALKMPVTLLDSRENPPKLAECQALFPDVTFITGKFPKAILNKAKMVVVSPGISKDHPDIVNAVASNTEIIGDIELFARAVRAPVVAITGSNGKSTVTTLVGAMAKKTHGAVGIGGNLGKPALSLLSPDNKLYILELSSFQLETTYSLKPAVATVLNLSPDHLDRYASIEDYRLAKLRIYNGCEKIVFNRADPLLPLNNTEDNTEKPYISFGLDVPLGNNYGLIQLDKLWLARGKEPLIAIDELKICGRHNVANALAALALGESVGLPLSDMLFVLKTFKGLEHACEWVRDYQGVKWVNDSKGTNVGATMAGLEGLGSDITGKWVLIAGGVSKNADFRPLVPLVQRYCKVVVLIGEAADELDALFHSVVPCLRAKDMQDAVNIAFKEAKSGDGVLLSPACASLDMFRNFAERGEVFKAAVLELN